MSDVERRNQLIARRNQLIDSLKQHVEMSKPNIQRITDLEDAKTEIRILNEQMGVLIDMVWLAYQTHATDKSDGKR